MHKIVTLVLLFVILIGLNHKANASYDDQKDAKTTFISPSVVGNYLSGGYAIRNQDAQSASKIFMKALKKDPKNPVLLKNGYKLMLSLGKVQQAVGLARQYLNYDKMDSSARILLATYEISNSQFGKAELMLDTISSQDKLSVYSNINSIIVPFLKLWTKVGRGKHKEAVKFSKNVLGEGRVPSMFLHYQSSLISDLSSDYKKADEGYSKITRDGFVIPYHFIKASGNFYERTGNPTRAKNLYLKYQKQSPQLGHFKEAIKRIDMKKEIPGKVVPDAKAGFAEVLKEAVRVLYNSGYYEEGVAYLQMVLFLTPGDDESKVLLASYYENNKQLKKAIKWHKKINKKSDFYLTSQVYIAEILYKLKQKEKAISRLLSITNDKNPSNLALLTLADLLRKDSKYAQAADVYTRIIKGIEKPDLQSWPVFFARGICYERAGKWDESEEDLLMALKLKPGQPEVLNYLGYSWIDRDKNIDAAKEMVETAVKARPNDAQIIDSMGWVLYKIKDFEGASKFLERATEIIPYDAVINDHLGDTYWKQGRFNEARFQWERVLKYNNSEDIVINEVKEKIKNGLPEEG